MLIPVRPEETHDEPEDDKDIIDHPNCHTSLNFFIPILSTILDGAGRAVSPVTASSAKAVVPPRFYWGVMFGTAVSFVWFRRAA